jgi:hypothetical protein
LTTVYKRKRNNDAAQTHIFVVGCGRYLSYRPDGSADREATVAGAREFIKFFLKHKKDLVAPLGSIEVVLSDPAVKRGQDVLGIGKFKGDPRRGNDSVDPATEKFTEEAADRWLDRCKAGDHLVFYMSSHGVAERDRSAVGLLEDVGSNSRNPWKQSINVTQLAADLPTLEAHGCWVFLDACQEVVTELIGQAHGAQGISLVNVDVFKVAQASRSFPHPVGLAGSRFGGKAWAPNNAKPPYFTQALLEAFSCCVEPVNKLGWAVTGKELLFQIGKVSDAALDRPILETQPLTAFNIELALLRVEKPEIPVAVRTTTEAHMAGALKMSASDENGAVIMRNNSELTWRFKVPADKRSYCVSATFKPGIPPHPDASFLAVPPVQIVVLKP